MAICTYQRMEVCMIVVKIEVKESIVTDYLLFVDGDGPFNLLEYARYYLAKMSQVGYYGEVKELIIGHGGEKLSDVPVENFVDFIGEVLKLYKEKTEG